MEENHQAHDQTPAMDKLEEGSPSPAPMNGHASHETNMLMSSVLDVSGADNPHNWPVLKKIHASAAGFAMTFAVGFGITAYTAGVTGVMSSLNLSMEKAISGLSLYIFGIFFAPIYTPHLSEQFGRSPVYLVNVFIWMLFILGASYSQTYAALAVCRFFAGFFGGATLVLIEGTFADVWGQCVTARYYSFLTMASYIGAACGPLVGGFVFAGTNNWRWTQWVTLMVGLAAYLFGIGLPETYPRQIARQKAKHQGIPHGLEPAPSGATLSAMLNITFLTPLKMLVTDPLVLMITFNLALNFALLFQFFVTVPVALKTAYMFDIKQIGLAFIAAIIGSLVALMLTTISDIVHAPKQKMMSNSGEKNCVTHVEFRMYPAIFGNLLMLGSLFWVGFTAAPTFHWSVPVAGTGVYVCGSALVLIAMVSYLFDAYTPRGTLSALTAAACTRVAFAGWLPLVIVQMFNAETPKWALATWGFIFLLTIPIPVVILLFGYSMRQRSAYKMM